MVFLQEYLCDARVKGAESPGFPREFLPPGETLPKTMRGLTGNSFSAARPFLDRRLTNPTSQREIMGGMAGNQ